MHISHLLAAAALTVAVAGSAQTTKTSTHKRITYIGFERPGGTIDLTEAAELNAKKDECHKQHSMDETIACITSYMQEQQALGLHKGVKILLLE